MCTRSALGQADATQRLQKQLQLIGKRAVPAIVNDDGNYKDQVCTLRAVSLPVLACKYKFAAAPSSKEFLVLPGHRKPRSLTAPQQCLSIWETLSSRWLGIAEAKGAKCAGLQDQVVKVQMTHTATSALAAPRACGVRLRQRKVSRTLRVPE